MASPIPEHTLFSLPIPALDSYPGGSLVATSAVSPDSRIYVLTLSSPPDNRLTSPVCTALLRALDILEFAYPSGVVVTTSAIAKFYSNGLDLEHAVATENYWAGQLYKLWKRLLTYPMPTVALINGHAFAGGLMTSMHHDYRIFNPNRGFLCLNELEFGAPLKAAMSGIFRLKCSAGTYRSLVLEAKRFPGKEALEAGLVDVLGGMEELVKFVGERKLTEKGNSGVYGLLKQEMYRECVDLLTLEGFEASEARDQNMGKMDAKRVEEGKVWVKEWQEEQGKKKSKL